MFPTHIEKHSEMEMRIKWNDGQTTTVPFLNLRYHCRCAECVDEWTRQRRITREQIQPDVKPTRVEMVGRYAIQIDWSDGHKTGIYTFALLYSIAKENTENV